MKKNLKTNVTIREVINGFLVEVYVYDATPVSKSNCCNPQPPLGYSDAAHVAKTFAEAQRIAQNVRLAKIAQLEAEK